MLELRYPPANKLELDFTVSRIEVAPIASVRRRGTLIARHRLLVRSQKPMTLANVLWCRHKTLDSNLLQSYWVDLAAI